MTAARSISRKEVNFWKGLQVDGRQNSPYNEDTNEEEIYKLLILSPSVFTNDPLLAGWNGQLSLARMRRELPKVGHVRSRVQLA